MTGLSGLRPGRVWKTVDVRSDGTEYGTLLCPVPECKSFPATEQPLCFAHRQMLPNPVLRSLVYTHRAYLEDALDRQKWIEANRWLQKALRVILLETDGIQGGD